MKRIKFYNILIALSLATTLIGFGQTNDKTKTLTGNYTNSGLDLIEARDWVKLDNTFSFTADDDKSITIRANEKLVCDADYLADPAEPSTSPDTYLELGSISGSFNVSSSGAATYTVPIAISPGTMGMQPSITIAYNSQSGNGPLGIGWNISGLSAITRVGANLYTDDEAGGVNLDADDKFALDGNRLLLSDGTYGSAGSSYTVQNQTFAYSSIDASGTAGNGPQYFIVTTKDGKTLYYGNSPDSRALADGSSTPYMWRLNKIEDANGNYMTYTYKTKNGESVIDEINYTGNDAAGLDTYNSLQFYYDTKSDANTYYIGGASVEQSLLLREIRSYSGDDLFRKYNLYYTESNFTHLNKITQSAFDGTELNPTIISWGEETTPYINNNNIDYFNNVKETAGDYNGDGRTDYFIIPLDNGNYTSTWKVYTTGISGLSFTQVSTGSLSTTNFVPGSQYASDFDGDGKDELIIADYFEYSGNFFMSYQMYELVNGGFSPTKTVLSYSEIQDNSLYYGDFDGDNKTDILYQLNTANLLGNNWILYSYDGDNWTSSTTGYLESFSDDDIKIIDFNGDGKKDIMVYNDESSAIYTIEEGSLTELYSDDFPTNSYRLFPADFNGDSKTDFLTYNTSGNSWDVYYSTGNTFVNLDNNPITKTIDPDNSESDYNYTIGEFNGDGKSDILEYYYVPNESASKINIYYSTGEDFYLESNTDDEIDWILAGKYYYDEFVDVNGDGRTDILAFRGSAGITDYVIFTHPQETHHLVSSITDGYSNTTTVTYKSLSASGSGYTIGSGATYPLMDYQGPIYVARTSTTPNGLGGSSVTTYTYAGAKIHLEGLGFKGFGTVTASNSTTGISSTTETTLDDTYYLTSEVINTVETFSRDTISTTTSTFMPTASDGSVFNPVTETVSSDELKNITATTTFTYRTSTGDLTKDKTLYSDGSYVQHDYSYYFMGKPGLVTLTQKHKDYSSTFQKKTRFDYDESTGSSGNLLMKTDNDGVSGKEVLTVYFDYNDVGQPGTVTQSATDVEGHTTYLTYDDTKRFVTEKENDFGTITAEYNEMTGQKVYEQDANGLEVTYTYDNWGRLTNTAFLTTGIEQSTTYNWYTGSSVDNALYYTYTTADNSPWVKSYYDSFGRKVYSESIGFSDVDINKTTTYNAKGQVSSTTSVKGGVTVSVDYGYDNYGRITDEDYNTGKTIEYEYSGLSTTIKDNGDEYIRTYDCVGNIVSAEEPITNHTITYAYHSNGSPSSITAPGSSISMGYDDIGNQTSLVDPDAGTSTYTYDAYGRLTYQKDGNGNEFTLEYDDLGRLESKVDQNGEETTYTYVESGNGKYQLLKESRGDLWKQYGYDSYGRVTTTTEHVSDDISNQVYAYTYNANSDVKTIVYPSGLTVVNTFDDYGFLSEITADNNTIWTLTSDNGTLYSYENGNETSSYYNYNSYGFPTQIYTEDSESNIIQGYSYSFDATTGNLTTRTDSRSGYGSLTETFSYDDINRLTSGVINSGTTYNYNYTSNGTGNFDSKSDAGIYVYSNSTKPHQLTRINAPTETFESQTVEYTTFNKADNISQGGVDIYSFTYGPDDQRRIMVNNVDGSTIYYFGANEIEVKDGITREISYISSGNGMIAIDVKRSDDNDTLYYVHKDHLGSVLAISNDKNDDVQLQNFDAWGRYRNPNTWAYSNSNRITATNRGFTGHEHLLACDLINMNGRVYDPFVGLFLSPDNYVQSPSSTQNFNRYAYALNNPLMYTDPSGEFIHLIAGAIIGGVINMCVMDATHQIEMSNTGEAMRAFTVGAAAGVLGAGVGTGISSVLGGGSFGAGFISSSVAETATTSFISGSAIGGGAGFVGGFTTGFGNSLVDGQNFGEALGNGLKTGFIAGTSGALLGGVMGGLDAVYGDLNRQRNFWTGDDIAMGRTPYAFNNTDRPFNAYRSTRGYETRSYYEGIMDGSKSKSYHDYIRYGDAPPNQISNGAISKIKNYTMPKDDIVNYTVEKFIGRADMNILDQASHDVVIRVNGNIVTPTNGNIPLWEGTRTVSVQIVNTNSLGGYISPYKFRITGYINW